MLIMLSAGNLSRAEGAQCCGLGDSFFVADPLVLRSRSHP